MNQIQNNIKPTDKICYNCKHLLWLVGVGQGLRCGFDMNKTQPIPSSMYTCDNFTYKMIGTKFTTTHSKKDYVVIEAHPMFEGTWKCYPAEKEAPYKPNLIDCFSTEFINNCLNETT